MHGWKLLSYLGGLFSGATLVSGRVVLNDHRFHTVPRPTPPSLFPRPRPTCDDVSILSRPSLSKSAQLRPFGASNNGLPGSSNWSEGDDPCSPCIYFRCGFFPRIPVTTGMIGESYKSSFTTGILGGGHTQNRLIFIYIYIYLYTVYIDMRIYLELQTTSFFKWMENCYFQPFSFRCKDLETIIQLKQPWKTP